MESGTGEVGGMDLHVSYESNHSKSPTTQMSVRGHGLSSDITKFSY